MNAHALRSEEVGSATRQLEEWISELERLELAVESAPWEWKASYQMPDEWGGLERRWAMRKVGCRDRVLSLGLVSESSDRTLKEPDAEMALLCALRNAAPTLLAIARAALKYDPLLAGLVTTLPTPDLRETTPGTSKTQG